MKDFLEIDFNKLELVIFDLDGTLIDSFRINYNSELSKEEIL